MSPEEVSLIDCDFDVLPVIGSRCLQVNRGDDGVLARKVAVHRRTRTAVVVSVYCRSKTGREMAVRAEGGAVRGETRAGNRDPSSGQRISPQAHSTTNGRYLGREP